MVHPLGQFRFCPLCGTDGFADRNEKAKQCNTCGFVYYFNPSAAVACFVKNKDGELLVVRRAKDPAKGTLDLAGGFLDMHETAEEAAAREIKEETGLVITECRYLFSLPNIYPYMGFNVHTLDLVFECEVESFDGVMAADDAEEVLILSLSQLNPSDFGLNSVRKAVEMYLARIQ